MDLKELEGWQKFLKTNKQQFGLVIIQLQLILEHP